MTAIYIYKSIFDASEWEERSNTWEKVLLCPTFCNLVQWRINNVKHVIYVLSFPYTTIMLRVESEINAY